MQSGRFATYIAIVAFTTAAATLTGCPSKGPAQHAGEEIDKAKDKVSDTLNPKGPVEKLGREIDRATD